MRDFNSLNSELSTFRHYQNSHRKWRANKRRGQNKCLNYSKSNCHVFYFVFLSATLCWSSFGVNGQLQDFFYPNYENCGNTAEVTGDVRTENPWTAAIFVRPNDKSPYEYFMTGAIIGPTTVLSLFGGGFGYPPNSRRGNRPNKYIVPPPDKYLVATGIKSTNLSDADQFTQIAEVTFLDPARVDSHENTDYHFVIYQLKRPLDFLGAHVRPVCFQYGLFPALRSVGFSGTYREIITITDEITKIGGFNVKDNRQSQSAPLTLIESRSSLDESCVNQFKFHYKYRPDWVSCTKPYVDNPANLTEAGKFGTCFSHGSLSLWKSTNFAISLVPAFGPDPRWHLSGLIALVPRKGFRKCSLDTTYFVSVTHSVNGWVKNHVICPPKTFPCGQQGLCIPLHKLCDGKIDCAEDGNDENSIFCGATFRCPSGNKYYQCGYEGPCILRSQIGDNQPDCPSGSDEDPKVIQSLKQADRGGPLSPQAIAPLPMSKPQHCFPIIVGEGVLVDCYHPKDGRQVNCSEATMGTIATLSCAEFYTSRTQSNYINMECSSNSKWKQFRRFSCTPECGLLGPEVQQPLIVHGKLAARESTMFPWHAALLRQEEANEDFKYACGASLIERNVFLSAAHCITDKSGELLPFNRFKILLNPLDHEILGGDNEPDPERLFNVEESWIPWSYNPVTLASDIAIIKIDRPVNYSKTIQPICYLVKSFGNFPAPGSIGKVTGYGLTESQKISPQLKYVELRTTAKPDCNAEMRGTFCAGSKDGKPAMGDSGGGLIYATQVQSSRLVRTQHVIKGIVSSWRKPEEHDHSDLLVFPSSDSSEDGDESGRNDVKNGEFTRFTHVDTHAEWILTTLEKIDTNPDPEKPDDSNSFAQLRLHND